MPDIADLNEFSKELYQALRDRRTVAPLSARAPTSASTTPTRYR